MTLTEILRVLQDIFLNFYGRISNSQPSLIRIHLQIEIYGIFSFRQNQITFYSLRRYTLYIFGLFLVCTFYFSCQSIWIFFGLEIFEEWGSFEMQHKLCQCHFFFVWLKITNLTAKVQNRLFVKKKTKERKKKRWLDVWVRYYERLVPIMHSIHLVFL